MNRRALIHAACYGDFKVGERVAEALQVPCLGCFEFHPLVGTRYGPLCDYCREQLPDTTSAPAREVEPEKEESSCVQ